MRDGVGYAIRRRAGQRRGVAGGAEGFGTGTRDAVGLVFPRRDSAFPGTEAASPGGPSPRSANNLIGPSSSVTLPPDTIGGDPMLLPLHDNGGPTRTHALRVGSPAVDAGNEVSGYTTDQRGTGFPRVVGAAADIGAFEGVDADSIFYSGFD